VKRLATFIGVECTDERAKQVVDTCSFENMKKAEANFKEDFNEQMKPEKGDSHIFRKGV